MARALMVVGFTSSAVPLSESFDLSNYSVHFHALLRGSERAAQPAETQTPPSRGNPP